MIHVGLRYVKKIKVCFSNTFTLQVLKWTGMESEWAELVEQATGWQHQLEEAEVGLSRLEAELNGLDSRLEGLEAESTAWCLPPSLDSARAELVELETAMVGLQELQEQVNVTDAKYSFKISKHLQN